MPLYIDRLPLYRWHDPTHPLAQDYWFVVVTALVTERGLPGPHANAVPQEWLLDTGNSGEAFAWRHHLTAAGLNPDTNRARGQMRIKSGIGKEILAPIRDADLWLLSNLPTFQNSPLRLSLGYGIPFRDVPALPDPQFQRPLIGLRALRRANLRIEIDFSGDRLSVWTP